MSDLLLTDFSAVVTFDRYDEIREALFNTDLSRSFDKRSYHDGNIRDGVVSASATAPFTAPGGASRTPSSGRTSCASTSTICSRR